MLLKLRYNTVISTIVNVFLLYKEEGWLRNLLTLMIIVVEYRAEVGLSFDRVTRREILNEILNMNLLPSFV